MGDQTTHLAKVIEDELQAKNHCFLLVPTERLQHDVEVKRPFFNSPSTSKFSRGILTLNNHSL
ncbi:hypothetical protein DPMN_165866 [Dreissena polymorpha]|uniref:Uncharacterized protein n=1 Tax=Dreissena polymorpha TaxID=45954 RepID=A0A9D4EYF5_DREPO|nr:hypothetical protein DPMN_165866 [Dreissena polymorpha]